VLLDPRQSDAAPAKREDARLGRSLHRAAARRLRLDLDVEGARRQLGVAFLARPDRSARPNARSGRLLRERVRALAATDEWKKYLADNLLIADFIKSREAVKFLDAEAEEYWALLIEPGLAE
jgi:hypothetical protein